MVTSYSIAGYAAMIADAVRMDAYVQALRNAVKPDSVVLDIGSGTGIFALLACKFGARRVYAIEPDSAIEVARESAARNGCADRIDFIQDVSTRVTLPERADVLISDLRGILPLFQHHIPSIRDARRRLLTPGAALIPCRDTLWAAVVEAPDLYARQVTPWGDHTYGLDLEASRRLLVNTWNKGKVAPGQLLVPPQCWAKLDYATVEDADLGGTLTWTATRPGTGHGLSVWFDAVLAEGLTITNAPGAPELIYGSAFFPWPEPVVLDAGDSVAVAFRADPVGDDYVWRWDSRVFGPGQFGQIKASFKQSTFFAMPLASRQLQQRAASHVPTLTEDGRLDQFILALMDGQSSLEAIARRTAARFPERFPHWQDALTRVGDLSVQYSRAAPG
jgi:protein arginine N-methyltransferase 1